nr:hypothetical protein [Cyanomargarita calcarea GSE-NOS-MK-12-04C]
MQTIQRYLGVNAPLLGAVNYLGMKNEFLLGSHNYNQHLGVFKPLTNDSIILGYRKHQPLIYEDIWNGESWNDDFLETVDFIPQQDNKETTTIISTLSSDPIASNINTDISAALKNKKKSASKSKSKSQTKTKPKSKSNTTSKKRLNSSVGKGIEKSFPENSTSINIDDDGLVKISGSLAIEPNYKNIEIKESFIQSEEETELQEISPQIEERNILSKKLVNNEIIIASKSLFNLPNLETSEESLAEEPEDINLLNNINKSSENKPFLSTSKQTDYPDNPKLSRELTNIPMPIIQASEPDILATRSIPKKQDIELENTVNKLSEIVPLLSTLNPSVIEEKPTSLRDSANDVQTEVSEVVNTPNFPINLTHQQQEIKPHDSTISNESDLIFENLSDLPEKKISQENCLINKEDEFRENFTQESILPTHEIADKVITPDAADISENLSYLP